jgi:phosphatidylinositol glycan class V
MLSCAREQWILAALFFAIAGSFRSNGIFLSGFLLWGMVIQPYLQSGKVAYFCIHFSFFLRSFVSLLRWLPENSLRQSV